MALRIRKVSGAFEKRIPGRKKAERETGSPLLVRASGEINGCQKFPPNEPKSTFRSLLLSHQWRIF